MHPSGRLILFGTRIGLNFSGGSNATVLLFQHIVPYFDEVYIVCRELGALPFRKNVNLIYWENEKQAQQELLKLSSADSIFYGDFVDAKLLVDSHLPFFFTYHDNWPEQQDLDEASQLMAQERIASYQEIFSAAIQVFSVSEFKRRFIQKATARHVLIRNGAFHPIHAFSQTKRKAGSNFKLLMMGNLDKRKYHYAIELFRKIPAASNLEVHIYGHSVDPEIEAALEEFPFVQLKGFQADIDLRNYHLLLSCSFIENLPISMLEALQNHTPVLSYEVGGIAEVVDHGKTGILIPPFDVDEMLQELWKIKAGEYSFSFHPSRYEAFNWEKSAKLMLKEFRKYVDA
ncbi:MAG: glycosyltransferase family 4 protein [Bacteroidia bacterium]|nr:glycosyltransferase family 4 protein [Bacteroidia bacterium]